MLSLHNHQELILIVLLTAAVFRIPVKPPVVAVEVFPFKLLPVIFNTPEGKSFRIPVTVTSEFVPVKTELIALLFILIVTPATAADTAVLDELMASNKPVTEEQLSDTELLLIVLVKVPAGVPVKSVRIPRKPDAPAFIPTAFERLFQLTFRPVWLAAVIPASVPVVPKKTALPLCAVLLPQSVMVFAEIAAAPPISLPGVILDGAPMNRIGLFTLLMKLP